MTAVRLTVGDVEIVVEAAGAKARDLARIARDELDHALPQASRGRIRPAGTIPLGFGSEIAEYITTNGDAPTDRTR